MVLRRDFLNGFALGTVGALAPRFALGLDDAALEKSPGYYPPALTGLRGSHEDKAAHALRDGSLWGPAGQVQDTGETYDLVVVGGGLSGLAAAYFFREAAGAQARILILENHDDFGGHARRNEFQEGGRTILGYGGSFSIDSPAPYSAVAQGLVKRLGVDVASWPRVVDRKLYGGRGLRPSVFFDAATFGADRLLPMPVYERYGEAGEAPEAPQDAWTSFLAKAPLSEPAKRDLRRIYTEPADYMPGLTSDQKKARLARMSYADFLTGPARAHRDVLPFFQTRPHSLYGVGIDAVPAQDAWGLGLPGFAGLKLDPAAGPGMNLDAIRHDGEPYFFHFPDGNATLARLMVRALIPRAIPGQTAEDIVTARADYARLDEPASPARLRLNSSVVRVAHRGMAADAAAVDVTYARGGRLQSVRGTRVVLACWNTMIPYLCPDLPGAQKDALAYAIKVPIVYTNVLLRSWSAFERLGTNQVYAPGSYHTSLNLDLPVSVGEYKSSRAPDEPIVVHMVRTPCSPGLPARQQHRAGRVELLSTTFDQFEQQIRDQLARTLRGGGFDAARDIRAITVNRWPHGYAYQYNSLWDPFWLDGGTPPCEIARRRFGRIAIANSDAAAYSYVDAAIDQAHRAVTEVMA
jgi:spermidine dehydrogenase